MPYIISHAAKDFRSESLTHRPYPYNAGSDVNTKHDFLHHHGVCISVTVSVEYLIENKNNTCEIIYISLYKHYDVGSIALCIQCPKQWSVSFSALRSLSVSFAKKTMMTSLGAAVVASLSAAVVVLLGVASLGAAVVASLGAVVGASLGAICVASLGRQLLLHWVLQLLPYWVQQLLNHWVQ